MEPLQAAASTSTAVKQPPKNEAGPAIDKGHHYLVTDKKLRSVALLVTVILMISWALQWVAFALPYWRGDEHHTGGLFHVCGTADFTYNPDTKMIDPSIHHEYRCESLDQYITNFRRVFENHTDSLWYQEIDGAERMIYISRWVEALSTVVDMAFGFTSMWAVVYPSTNENVQRRNVYISIFGILLAPFLCIVDSVLQFGGDVIWVATGFDLIIQLTFLDWGVRREFRLKREARKAAAALESNADHAGAL